MRRLARSWLARAAKVSFGEKFKEAATVVRGDFFVLLGDCLVTDLV
jgi:hypothetical protein